MCLIGLPVIPHTATPFEYIPNAPMIDLFTEGKSTHGSAHRNRHNGII
jgi:hypothetical protein